MAWMSRPDYGVIRFSGADAREFLQGQLTNNIRLLEPGKVMRAAYCTAQGRVIAIVTLVPDDQDLLAILPAALLPTVMARLRLFVLRARVTLQDCSEELPVQSSEQVPAALAAVAPMAMAPDARSWLASRSPALAFRLHGEHSALPFDLQAAALAQVRCGLPELDTHSSEQYVPQMLNLDLLDAISFAKGCYTGQEIVARTQNLGRIKRRLFRVGGSGAAPAQGEPIRSGEDSVGQVLLAAAAGDDYEALAVLRLEAVSAGHSLQLARAAVRLLPLPYSLPEIQPPAS